jgi:hypothetical protein
MSQKLSPEQVAVVIKAKKILKAQGLSPDTDVKTICQAAGISRAEHEDLKKRFDDVRFENEGRKIAWEIHEVDKLLAEKKSTMNRVKSKKR